jgi:hypothetical protein
MGQGAAMPLLSDPGELQHRLSRLGEPHVSPLEALRAGWAADGRTWPHVDPADGGVDARVLLLLETPGPALAGARLVSMDNRTGTGRNLRRFVADAGLARDGAGDLERRAVGGALRRRQEPRRDRCELREGPGAAARVRGGAAEAARRRADGPRGGAAPRCCVRRGRDLR